MSLKTLKTISIVWSVILFFIGVGENHVVPLILIGAPWMALWVGGYLRSTKGNPYMDMTDYVSGESFPEVKFNAIPMEINEYPFYAIPALRLSLPTPTQKAKVVQKGNYLVTNKRICFIASRYGFGYRINEVLSAKISGKNTLSIKHSGGVSNLQIHSKHIGYAYSFTNGALNGLESIDYSKAATSKDYMKSIHKEIS